MSDTEYATIVNSQSMRCVEIFLVRNNYYYWITIFVCFKLTNIEAGRYVFELTVTDDQGESARDTVSVQVKPDPLDMKLLEMTLNIPISTFTKSQLDSFVQKMTLLLKDGITVNVTEIHGEVDTGNTLIVFFLSEKVFVYEESFPFLL